MNEYSFPTQFIDLKAQQELIRDRLDIAVKKVLDHGLYQKNKQTLDPSCRARKAT